jgi:hypothetical protein
VAVAGDEKATSAEDDFAVSRSKRFETPMYLIADSYSNTSKQVYDDILSNRPDINATHSFVFPLTGSESRVIASVRLWPRNDWTEALYGRTIYARVEIMYKGTGY